MKFSCEITCDNAAFDDGEGGRAELSRLLANLAAKVATVYGKGAQIYDITGNRVGHWAIMED